MPSSPVVEDAAPAAPEAPSVLEGGGPGGGPGGGVSGPAELPCVPPSNEARSAASARGRVGCRRRVSRRRAARGRARGLRPVARLQAHQERLQVRDELGGAALRSVVRAVSAGTAVGRCGTGRRTGRGWRRTGRCGAPARGRAGRGAALRGRVALGSTQLLQRLPRRDAAAAAGNGTDRHNGAPSRPMECAALRKLRAKPSSTVMARKPAKPHGTMCRVAVCAGLDRPGGTRLINKRDGAAASPRLGDQPPHALHDGRQAVQDGLAHDEVSDVQLDDLGQGCDGLHVVVGQSMPGVTLQA